MAKSIESRIEKIEKVLNTCVKGRCYVDIWTLSDERCAELAEWALGNTDKCPDFWPSEERAVELRKHGYIIETRNGIHKIVEDCIELNQKAAKAGDGIDWQSIRG